MMIIMKIETKRLKITQFDESMVESVYRNSLDDDVRTFVPDEVFDTIEKARDIVWYLMQCYNENTGPFVYPILIDNNENIGYVEVVPLGSDKWEIGYHIAKAHTGKGFATEAVMAFIPIIKEKLGITEIWGICRADNVGSRKVLEKCRFELHDKAIRDYKGEQHEVCTYLHDSIKTP